ncbi:Nramp family divalent metal transporter [Gammaproteobacteria bacterium]|jgi:Mn2+/Fe2+ NRAMP family transporter|nr:Nramp family divalent metal transporter [Gammaproteobacteria bacterium]
MDKPPTTLLQRIQFIGPSIIVTGSVVGTGAIVLAPLLGAATGFTLLWWLLLSLWSKPLIQAEISRYVIATNQTFLEAFSDMPGPKTNIRGKQASWLVWFMFIGVIPSIAGMGGLAGAVAEAGHAMIPSLSVEAWVVTACFVTWFILYLGSYQSLEKILLAMVFFFSVVTLVIAIAMQSTSYAFTSEQIIGGLSFSFPFEHTALALAVFGFTGISFGEIMAYTYWCLEKGYAKPGGDVSEKKAWIKIMQTDVWATVFFVTLGTLPFFLLGAAVLNTLGLYPPPEGETLDIIQLLLNNFTKILGSWAKWLFIPLAFFVLFSTLLSGTAAFTRTISDYLISMGLVIEQEDTRSNLIKIIAFVIPMFSAIAYFLLPNPITLILIAGIWAALGLPIINFGALFLTNRLRKDLQPQLLTKIILFLTLMLQLGIAALFIYTQS